MKKKKLSCMNQREQRLSYPKSCPFFYFKEKTNEMATCGMDMKNENFIMSFPHPLLPFLLKLVDKMVYARNASHARRYHKVATELNLSQKRGKKY